MISRYSTGLLLVAALATGGRTYQWASSTLDEGRNPEPGRLTDIGDLRLNIHCTGAGRPTVVLETGLGGPLEEWSRVQSEVSGFTRVCSYDRAGYGRSEAGPFPRTSAQIADELHALLTAAGESSPYVLVGHSVGGYHARVFNGSYPADLAAMVLVDATHEDQYSVLPRKWDTLGAALLERYQSQARWAPLLVEFGWTRLMLRIRGVKTSQLILQTKYLRARAGELESIRVSAEQARASGTIGDKPLVVLTAGRGPNATAGDGLGAEDVAAYQDAWVHDLQLRLVQLSQNGRRIMIPDSGHDIPRERPDAIVDAVREVVSAVVTREAASGRVE